MSLLHSFGWLSNIPLYRQTTYSLSIHLLMDIWVASTFRLLKTAQLQTFVNKFISELLFSIFLGIYLEVGHGYLEAGPYGTSVFNLLRNHQMFSTKVTSFYISTSNVQRFQLLCILANICYFPFF